MTKPSDTKGFWGNVTRHASGVTGEMASHRVTLDVTVDSDPLRDAYVAFAQSIRAQYATIPTKSGRPKQGPKWMAVTLCADENEYGLTDSARPKDQRFRCSTCYGFKRIVWSDRPDAIPTIEEQEQTWADWASKQGPSTPAGKWRDKLRAMGVLKGRDA